MGGRLHPAVAAVRRAVRQSCEDLEGGRRVVVACSGGPDSTALAAAALFESRRAGWSLSATVVDHRLQPGSEHVAGVVSRRLTDMGYRRVVVKAVSVGTAGGPEAAARTARYEALTPAADGDDAVVLLGHTRDDQAETVLLGLLRGSGLRSLSGMAAARGCFRRPLLHVSRADTAAACEAMGLEVWDDPHNDDRRFARVRVRRDALPALESALGPGVVEALARTADLARDDADALDALAAATEMRAGSVAGSLAVDVLEATSAAVRRRVLRRAALAAGSTGGELSAGHVQSIEQLVTRWRGQSTIDLPGHVVAWREAGRIHFGPAGPRPPGAGPGSSVGPAGPHVAG